jgi:sulfatase maturation enzyme AslB (radical SAM superfamily)
MNLNSNNLCPLLWVQSYIGPDGIVYPCCASNTPLQYKQDKYLLNNKTLRSARLQMLAGNFPDICNHCKMVESLGHDSHRQSMISAFHKSSDKIDKVIKMTAIDGKIKTPQLYYDIRPSNNCNLSCRMCCPGNSNSWNHDWQLLNNGIKHLPVINWFTTDQQNLLITHIKQSINYWGYAAINLAGGEPFQDPKCLNLLDVLIENNLAKDIELFIVSNLTKIPKGIYGKLDLFKEVVINISIEGIGKVNDYIRYPSQWNIIQNNIFEIIQKPYLSLAIVSLSIYSIMYVSETLKWFDENNINVYFKYVYLPERLFIGNFPMVLEPASKKLKSFLESYSFKNDKLKDSGNKILQYLISAVEEKSLLEEFLLFNDKLDIIRKESMKEYLPELAEILNV